MIPESPETPPPRLIVVLGPTAAGKTRLGVLLARRLRGEIVSADAFQVYRGFDAATGKPDGDERAAAPHALVDTVDPRRDYSLGDFVRDAEREIARIAEAGLRPVVVGGTGLYLRGLLKGVFAGPARDEALRARLLERAAAGPHGLLHRFLSRLDPESAARLRPADLQRVVRALEVVLTTGRSMGEAHDGGWLRADRYPSVKIGLRLPRVELYRRIDARVLRFFEAGLVDEVRRLLAAGVPESANAFKAIGYREVLAHLAGESDLEEAVALVQRSTRRFAKRQLTWFRKEAGVAWFDATEEALGEKVEAHVREALAEGAKVADL